jgi:hypothetical protein
MVKMEVESYLERERSKTTRSWAASEKKVM